MSHGDLLSDRKRLKRKLGAWRFLALVLVFAAAAVVAHQYTGKKLGGGASMPGKGYIAQITIEGFMSDDPKRLELLDRIREDSSAKALLVQLDSPGGTTVAGEELYLQLQKISKVKPVIGVMRTVCASACYMASLGAEHVIARDSSLTGSIGVLMQSVEVSRLADKLGITPITIKSGKYKDSPSFTEPLSDDEREVARSVVMDAYDQFVEMIAKRRGMSEDQVRTLADGRVYTGRQAAPLKLIDGIGGVDEAKAWLVAEKKLDRGLDVRPMDKETKLPSLFGVLNQWTGIEIFGQRAIALDGLISIWQHSPVQ